MASEFPICDACGMAAGSHNTESKVIGLDGNVICAGYTSKVLDEWPSFVPRDIYERMTRLVVLSLHAAGAVGAVQHPGSEMAVDAFQALCDRYKEFYPNHPRDGVFDIIETASILGLKLEPMPDNTDSKYGPN